MVAHGHPSVSSSAIGGFVAHVLAYLILAHMVLTAVGIIVKLLKAKWEDDHNF